jgi:hypothetical protein
MKANGSGGKALWIWLVAVLVGVPRWSRAQELQYAAIDRATVRVLALGLVDLAEVDVRGHKLKLASPIGGHGSGVIVSKDGLLVTAAHVVAGARAVAVHAPGVLGPLEARVVLLDETRDVALLRVNHSFESVAALGPAGETLAVRQTVFAIGYPLDVTRSDPQSSRGSVSGLLPDGRLQLDISVNPGNSGGPVVDEKDRVFAIVSARGNIKQGIVGLGVAIPLDAFRAALDAELQKGPGSSAAPAGHMADLVSVVAHEGAAMMQGSIDDNEEPAARAEREARRLLGALPDSADAQLLGAAFFWNRHAVGEAAGHAMRDALSEAERLVKRAVELEPSLKAKSKFVQFMSGPGKDHVEVTSTEAAAPIASGHAIRFSTSQKGTALYVKSGEVSLTATAGLQPMTFKASEYQKLCDLPCDIKLPSGRYDFAVGQSGVTGVLPAPPVQITGPTTLQTEYHSNQQLRSGGAAALVVGLAAGGGLTLAGLRSNCHSDYGVEACDGDSTLTIGGVVVTLAGSLAGLVLMSQRDTASVGPQQSQQVDRPVHVTPFVSSSNAGRVAPVGLALTGSF